MLQILKIQTVKKIVISKPYMVWKFSLTLKINFKMTFRVRMRKININEVEFNTNDLFERVEIQSKDIILNLMIKDGIIENKPEWLHESCLISFFKYVMKFKNPEIKFKNYEIKLYDIDRKADMIKLKPSRKHLEVYRAFINIEELNNLIYNR